MSAPHGVSSASRQPGLVHRTVAEVAGNRGIRPLGTSVRTGTITSSAFFCEVSHGVSSASGGEEVNITS